MASRSDPVPFDLTVFDQSNYWTGADGHRHVIEDLDPDDRADLVAWLLRNADHFYLIVLASELLKVAHPDSRGVPALTFGSSTEWMAETPLVRSLTAGPTRAVPSGDGRVTVGRRRVLDRLLRR